MMPLSDLFDGLEALGMHISLEYNLDDDGWDAAAWTGYEARSPGSQELIKVGLVQSGLQPTPSAAVEALLEVVERDRPTNDQLYWTPKHGWGSKSE